MGVVLAIQEPSRLGTWVLVENYSPSAVARVGMRVGGMCGLVDEASVVLARYNAPPFEDAWELVCEADVLPSTVACS
jgi:hypothetical protein